MRSCFAKSPQEGEGLFRLGRLQKMSVLPVLGREGWGNSFRGPGRAGQRGVGSGCGFPEEKVKFWKLSYWCQGETLASHCSPSPCTQGEGGSLESGPSEWLTEGLVDSRCPESNTPPGGSHHSPVPLLVPKEALLKGLPSPFWKHMEWEGCRIWESKDLDLMSVLSAVSYATLGKSLSSQAQFLMQNQKPTL